MYTREQWQMGRAMNPDELIDLLLRELQAVPGVAAVVLGGSRARGTHTPQSDIDLALYYRPEQPLDLARLAAVAAAVDDRHRADLITAPGGWGPWINGGGWLSVHGTPVDLLYRDLRQVTATIEECLAGIVGIAYQPGHPHGFSTAIYLAEVALCRPLWDPDGAIAALRHTLMPYPAALKSGLVTRFFWEAGFSLQVARKGLSRSDSSYIAGCCFRCVSCVLQTLFAVNETYFMNEKGAVALAGTFSLAPLELAERIERAYQHLSPDQDALALAIGELEELVAETAMLLDRAR